MRDIKEPYFIKKGEFYYRKDYKGYTINPAQAGIYEKDEAIKYTSHKFSESRAIPACNTFYNDIAAISEMIDNLTIIKRAIELKACRELTAALTVSE